MEDNDLWQAFLFEVNEQLESLEKELIHIKSDDQEIINQLFRYFHTIKSSCAMFEFSAMEELAHAAENILDQIRKGVSSANEEVIGVLLGCVDCLKEQLGEAEATRYAPSPNPAMMRELAAYLVEDNKPVVQDFSENENTLGIDAEIMEEYAEITVDTLERFFQAQASADIDKALSALDKWKKATDVMAFNQLSENIGLLIRLINKESFQLNARFLQLFAKIADIVKRLEELSGQSFAFDQLYPHVDRCFSVAYKNHLQALNQHLVICLMEANDNNAVAEESLDLLCKTINEILPYYQVFGFSHARDFYSYFLAVCRKAIIHQQKLDVNLITIFFTVADLHIQAVSDYEQQLLIEQKCVSSIAAFRQALRKDEDDNFDRDRRLDKLTAALDLPADYLNYIDNAEIESAENYFNDGKTFVLMLVDLEVDHEWSKKFALWLNEAIIITSRTLFSEKLVDGKLQEYTKTSFLLTFDKSADEVRHALDSIGDNQPYIESIDFKQDYHAPKTISKTGKKPAKLAKVSKAVVKPEQTGKPVSITVSGKGEFVADDVPAKVVSRLDKLENTKSIRVGSDAIDRFVVQVGEMVLQRNMLSHAINDKDVDSILKKCKAILATVHDGVLPADHVESLKESLGSLSNFFDVLVDANNNLTHSVSQVQEEVMSLRVVPISIVFDRLPRIIRYINSEYHKDIRLDISGEQIRVDKSLIDVLMEPLVHLVRNCADHGIESKEARNASGKTEPATITVSAEQAGNVLYIKVADNGVGLNYQKIHDKGIRLGMLAPHSTMDTEQLKQLIFAPGFSTSEMITETSGRGVGMDAVKNSLMSIGGSIDVQTEKNAGTTFILKLPISAAIQGVIVFEHQGETLTIPERNVVFGLSVPVEKFQTVQGQAAFVYKDNIIPVYGISELLDWKSGKAGKPVDKIEQEILIITDDTHHMGLAVDKVIGRQEIFVRDLHKDLMNLPGVGGASILGNGDVVLILSCEALMQIASKNSQNVETLLKVS